MSDEPKPSPQSNQPDAAQHVAEAHRLLRALQLPLDKHPELEKAIDNLELALSILANKTGGML
ncbi:MAG TPA: hypothetical protein VFB04_01605 [Terriglobales bacterium]|nr:hypothetical protein [Terriglobales bacterium]